MSFVVSVNVNPVLLIPLEVVVSVSLRVPPNRLNIITCFGHIFFLFFLSFIFCLTLLRIFQLSRELGCLGVQFAQNQVVQDVDSGLDWDLVEFEHAFLNMELLEVFSLVWVLLVNV